MKKLNDKYQGSWSGSNLFLPNIEKQLQGYGIKIHEEISNVMSSQAACLNVFGYLSQPANVSILKSFLSKIGISVDEIIPFPTGSSINDRVYPDEGNVIYEWIGPQASIINEGNGGGRGFQRTSIDAFILVKMNGKITQLIIEWKFTESYRSLPYIARFAGGRGLERLKRYSPFVAKYRSNKEPLFEINDDDNWGEADLGYEPYYQLLRMSLLARETIGMKIGSLEIEDYRIVHLSHSANENLNILHEENLRYCPGLISESGKTLHFVWTKLLSDKEKERFIGAYWDDAIKGIDTSEWYNYCNERYLE